MDDWQARFTRDALAQVDAYTAAHPGLTRHGVEQPGQGATNRVVLVRDGSRLLVCKVFCETERKERACYAYRHWAETGLVPELIDEVGERMIVTSFVPGVSLPHVRRTEDAESWLSASRGVGAAVGTLTSVPLDEGERAWFERTFYDGLGALREYLGRVLELGHSIHRMDPDFQDPYWGENLRGCEAQLPVILSQPRVLYHQDVGNLHVRGGRFVGFFDLEMCRVGGAAMQLAAALGMLEGEGAAWRAFQAGWEEATGVPLGAGDLAAAAAAKHLLGWREICRYMSYDGTPGSGYAWASPADPDHYRGEFEATVRLMALS